MSASEESPTPAKVPKLTSSVTEISSTSEYKLSSSITEISSDNEPNFLDVETQKALEDIDSCQNDIDALNEKASEEILQVEMKYNRLRRPHFEKRNNLIKYIPNFWVTSFLNHPRMANIVEEEEEECLHYLKQVDVEEFEDIKSGYTIRFQFASNPYFTDSILTKEFHLAAMDGKPGSRCTQIQWKPNMDLTKYTRIKQFKHPRRQVEGRSFFSWLADNIDPSRDKIAEIIKDDLWPNPLQYYLASDIEVEENGIDSEDDNVIEDDSVVIVGDDDDDDDDGIEDDDDDVYEVKDDEDDGDVSAEELEETVESIEVDDDDEDEDEAAIEVLGSDSEAELLQEASEVPRDPYKSKPSFLVKKASQTQGCQIIIHGGEISPDENEILPGHSDMLTKVSSDNLQDSSVSNNPDTSQTGDNPDTSQLVDDPDTSQMGDKPDTSQLVDDPDTSQSGNKPDTSQLVGDPDTSQTGDNPATSQTSDYSKTSVRHCEIDGSNNDVSQNEVSLLTSEAVETGSIELGQGSEISQSNDSMLDNEENDSDLLKDDDDEDGEGTGSEKKDSSLLENSQTKEGVD